MLGWANMVHFIHIDKLLTTTTYVIDSVRHLNSFILIDGATFTHPTNAISYLTFSYFYERYYNQNNLFYNKKIDPSLRLHGITATGCSVFLQDFSSIGDPTAIYSITNKVSIKCIQFTNSACTFQLSPPNTQNTKVSNQTAP